MVRPWCSPLHCEASATVQKILPRIRVSEMPDAAGPQLQGIERRRRARERMRLREAEQV